MLLRHHFYYKVNYHLGSEICNNHVHCAVKSIKIAPSRTIKNLLRNKIEMLKCTVTYVYESVTYKAALF